MTEGEPKGSGSREIRMDEKEAIKNKVANRPLNEDRGFNARFPNAGALLSILYRQERSTAPRTEYLLISAYTHTELPPHGGPKSSMDGLADMREIETDD
ncbi:hypothetical protein KQX54_021744 [Cotesia glomerata]|uniref:Uncharacterized protein n=1 Tax=Cotesia glomerata TaxID=32391 RepID=A0AAV7J9Z0_COTGL|nr:hypothetical protein KQX54_021744 [Cotesia glomerata]